MATDRKKIINGIIIGALGLGILGAGIWYFFFRDKCDANKKGYTKKGKISAKCVGETNNANTDPNTETSTPPAGCKWVSDNTFPLKRCMIGNKIGALQTALGFTGSNVDKKFGNDTLGAVQNKFGGRSEVTQAEYEALLNPPTTGGGQNFGKLKTALGDRAKNFSAGVYVTVLGQNKNYKFSFYADNGRVFMQDNIGDTILYRGTYSDGGKKIVMDNGASYEEGGVFLNMQEIVKDLGQ